jgi:hypothetical protein
VTFGNPIVSGGGVLLREAVRSPNYVPGGPGWKIDRDGSVEFTNGRFRGSVEAEGGSFRGDLTAGTVNGRAVPAGWIVEGRREGQHVSSTDAVEVLAGFQQELTGGRLYRLEGEVFQILVDAGVAVDLTLRGAVTSGALATTLPRLNAKRVEANVGQVVTALVQPDVTAVWDLVMTAHRIAGAGAYTVRATPTAAMTLTLFDIGTLPPIP